MTKPKTTKRSRSVQEPSVPEAMLRRASMLTRGLRIAAAHWSALQSQLILPVEPGHGSLRSQFGAGVVGRASGRKPSVRRLGGQRLRLPKATRSRAIPTRGECPEKRPVNPRSLCCRGDPIRHGPTGTEAEDLGFRRGVRAMDCPKLRSGGPPNVQGGPCAVLVALGAADGDAGGPVAPKRHVGPRESGSFGGPKHGVPHDRCERDVHQTAEAGLAGPLGSTARSRAPQLGSRTDRGQPLLPSERRPVSGFDPRAPPGGSVRAAPGALLRCRPGSRVRRRCDGGESRRGPSGAMRATGRWRPVRRGTLPPSPVTAGMAPRPSRSAPLGEPAPSGEVVAARDGAVRGPCRSCNRLPGGPLLPRTARGFGTADGSITRPGVPDRDPSQARAVAPFPPAVP